MGIISNILQLVKMPADCCAWERLQLETLPAVISCQRWEGSSRQHHSSLSCGHLSLPLMESLDAWQLSLSLWQKWGAGWVQCSRWRSHNCQSRWFCLGLCTVLIFLLSTLKQGCQVGVLKLFLCGWHMQLHKQTRPGGCSAPCPAPDPWRTGNEGLHAELLQQGSQQPGPLSAFLPQDLSSSNSGTHKQALMPQMYTLPAPKWGLRPRWGVLPTRVVSALGKLQRDVPPWTSKWSLKAPLAQATLAPQPCSVGAAPLHTDMPDWNRFGDLWAGCYIWWQVGCELCNYLSVNYASTQCPFLGICILPYNVLCL